MLKILWKQGIVEMLMWLITGLGNPGKEYDATRHNIGFMVTDLFAQMFPVSFQQTAPWYHLRQITIRDENVLLIQPQTYMNRSGLAVEKILRHYHESPERLVVVYDDLDLAPGRLRIRKKGGDGGHKGVKSIIENLDTDQFIRIRIGIGRPQRVISPQETQWREDVVEYVLQPFTKDEYAAVREVMQLSVQAIELIVTNQVSMAMNLYNRS